MFGVHALLNKQFMGMASIFLGGAGGGNLRTEMVSADPSVPIPSAQGEAIIKQSRVMAVYAKPGFGKGTLRSCGACPARGLDDAVWAANIDRFPDRWTSRKRVATCFRVSFRLCFARRRFSLTVKFYLISIRVLLEF